jgi:hypothetical protein
MKTAHRNASRAKRSYEANPRSWFDAVVNSRPPPEDHATTVMNKIRAAFEALKNGTTDCALFDRLAATINVGLIRAEAIDPFVVQTMVSAVEAMGRCDEIYGRHKRYGFQGPDLHAVADAVNMYEGILRNSSPHLMEQAVLESARRIINQAQAERLAA